MAGKMGDTLMPGGATLTQIMDAQATIELAGLASHGLKAAYGHKLPAGLTNNVPAILRWLAPAGGRMSWQDGSMQGRTIGQKGNPDVIQAGTRTREWNLEIFTAVCSVSPDWMRMMDQALPWAEYLDDLYCLHTQLGGLVLRGVITACRFQVVPIGDTKWFGTIHSYQALTRHNLTPGQ
jgi:hypothetical protein